MKLLLLSFLYSSIAIGCPSKESKPAKIAAMKWTEAHNKARREKGIPPLIWDKKLVRSAKEWAKHLGSVCKMYHEKGSGYGENLYMAMGSETPPPKERAVESWLEEEKYYDPSAPRWCKPGSVCTHYTQALWMSSTFLGCAEVSCTIQHGKWAGKKGHITVCRYDPAGNFLGQRPF